MSVKFSRGLSAAFSRSAWRPCPGAEHRGCLSCARPREPVYVGRSRDLRRRSRHLSGRGSRDLARWLRTKSRGPLFFEFEELLTPEQVESILIKNLRDARPGQPSEGNRPGRPVLSVAAVPRRK